MTRSGVWQPSHFETIFLFQILLQRAFLPNDGDFGSRSIHGVVETVVSGHSWFGNEDLLDLGSIIAPTDLNDPDSEEVYWVVPEEDLWRALGYLKFYLYLLEHNAGSIWLPGETPSVGIHETPCLTWDDDGMMRSLRIHKMACWIGTLQTVTNWMTKDSEKE